MWKRQVTHRSEDFGLGLVEQEYTPRWWVVVWPNGTRLLELADHLRIAGYQEVQEE